MTDEAQGNNFEDVPARPASTRWSEDPVHDDDDDLAPPYVPGRSAPAASSDPDDFPFDQFAIDGSAEAAAVEETESESDDMGWSPADLDDRDDAASYSGSHGFDEGPGLDAELEPVTESDPVEQAESFETPEWEPDSEPEPEPDYDTEGTVFQPDGTIESEPSEPTDTSDTADAGQHRAGGVRAEQAAATLDRLAGMLREDGVEAVSREMDSDDRLTALVSSLLTGHLSTRR